MTWWKKALYDTCSLITLDKLFLEQIELAEHFPITILALEESFLADQLRDDTAQRMRPRVTICSLPPPEDLARLLASPQLSKSLATIDTLIYATAVHGNFAVVTADKQLAKVVRLENIKVGNMAIILRELVSKKMLTVKSCERLLQGLASRKDFLLGISTPTWRDLQKYSFPDK
ncbi:MAG TPA: PIN domain-containing protein [Thermoguttaceae bacterium]